MTVLHLVRHGPTHAKSMVGWSDLPADLSDQALLRRLACHLPADAVVLSSDLCRATATADAIQGTRQRLAHDPDLREINFGAWELRRAAEVEAEDPDLICAYWDTPGDIRPPHGESWNEMRARADAAIDRAIADHRGGHIVVVAHFGVILTQVQRALGLSAYDTFAYRIDNLSVTDMRIGPGGWQIGRINHLP